MSTTPIRIAIVEDKADEREILCQLLAGSPGLAVVSAHATAEDALSRLPAIAPDIVLMDIHLPDLSGTEAVRRLRNQMPGVRFAMLTAFDDHDRIFEALRAGAHGYLLKNTPPAKLAEALCELHAGGAPMSGPIARLVVASFHGPSPEPDELHQLSPRERQVLDLLSQGFLYKEIADHLDLNLGTIRTYVSRTYDKLHVRSRTEATRKALGAR